MSTVRAAAILAAKELRAELRTRELLATTIVFVLVVVVLFSFTFDPTSAESRRFGPGLLWLAFLFAASLMLQPCFLREQTNDTLSALRLSVDDPFAIFLSKLCANTLFAISAQARMRELLLPLLLLPLLTPLLIASTEATAALLAPNPALRWDWLAILIAFDVIFLTAVWLFGEYLLEE